VEVAIERDRINPPVVRGVEVAEEWADVVQVIDVARASPADRAGLRLGDVIVALAGQPVAGVDDVHRALSKLAVGATLELDVLRGAEVVHLTVRLAAAAAA
jgi:S1-C subfamily serine protease